MNRLAFRACALLLGLCLFDQVQAVAYQGAGRRAKKPPETSKVADFDPNTLAKLAVLVVGKNPRELQSDHQRLVEDAFLQNLLAKGHTIVARSDLQSVLKEKRFQTSGLTEDNAASIGKLLNVPAVLVVRITEASTDAPRSSMLVSRASVGARLLSVETGSILWTGKHSETEDVATRSAASQVLLDTASALAATFPEKTSGNGVSAKPIDPTNLPKLAVITVGGGGGSRSGFGFGPSAGLGRPNSQANTQSDQQRLVEDAFIQALMEKGYRLVSRSDLQSIAQEQQFQRSGLTEDNAVAVGKLLNVRAVLVVRITDFATDGYRDNAARRQVTVARVALGARLVDVDKGQIWWTRGESLTREVAGRGDSSAVLEQAAKELATAFPPAPEPKKPESGGHSGGARGTLEQAEKLESAKRIPGALNYYRSVIKNYPGTPEAKTAEARIKALSNK